jgi:hypothetical protein
MHCLNVAPIFLSVDYGGMSISTGRERLIPEVTSLVDIATVVFYSCFVDIHRLSYTLSTLLAYFLLRKVAERQFRPLGGVLDRKCTLRIRIYKWLELTVNGQFGWPAVPKVHWRKSRD